MKIKKTVDSVALNIISYAVIGFFAFITVLPFVMLVVSSFSSENYIINNGYSIIPKSFSLEAYGLVFLNPKKILQAYEITLFITIIGTMISLFISSMTAYVLYRKDLKFRNQMTFFLYFTTLFNGGLAPYYILVTSVLHLKNSILVLLLVPMFNVLNILILRNFIRGSIPDSLVECSKIDGAGDFTIFIKVILPLCKPALASIGLFTALGYWNDWWTAMMFVEKERLFPLQYVLYNILSSVNAAANMISQLPSIDMPKESLKLAMTVISTGPIIFLYPFVQKYFVKGITLGAVKG